MYSEPFETPLSKSIYEERYKHPEDVNWLGTGKRVVGSTTGALYFAPKAQNMTQEINELQERLQGLVGKRMFFPGGRYLYGAGRDLHQVNNCVLLKAGDSREGFADTSWRADMALMYGAGIGVWYGEPRAAGTPISRTGGTAAGPISLMEKINDGSRSIISGGNRRSAIWAGLPWWHPDIFKFITSKDWSQAIREMKGKDRDFPAPMDKTNISVTLDDEFFRCYEEQFAVKGDGDILSPAPDGGSWHSWAHRVYDTAMAHMLRHGEPGFTVDVGIHAGEVCRNACCEITSADDSDICNLGSLVLPRFENVKQFREAVKDAVMFLTAGSLYSDVPYDKIADIRDKNRRLGLGLIGVHEFLMKNGVRYGTDNAFELMEPYMIEYARALEYANEQQDALGISTSVGATAIAPNGTIGILADSTPSGDPMFSAAEIRSVVVASPHGDTEEHHVVVDPTAARLVREGIEPGLIEDAHSLSLQPERRLAQQAFMQDYTDHAISSTVNLAAPMTELPEIEDFGNSLMEYLPRLRGITCYPDGARAGQPRKPCDLAWALERDGTIFEGNEELCAGGVCGV